MTSATDPQVSSGKFVDANGLTIYYAESGDGPPLILLHGGGGTSASWQFLLGSYASHFHVYLPDSRGHGRTVNPADSLSYAQMADDVAAFIQALQLNRPCVFGYSDGGQIALELAMRYGHLLSSAVVGGVVYELTDATAVSLRGLGFTGPGSVDFEHFQAAAPDWVNDLQQQHPREDNPDYWRTLVTQLATMWHTPLGYTRADLAAIPIPILILVGDRDDLNPPEQSFTMYRTIPHAELAVIPNAGHFSALNEPALALILDFLSRHCDQPGGQV